MPTIKNDELAYCEKCNKTMRVDQFYGTNNIEKYPTGHLNYCKKCMAMHVDNWNPETYLWIIQECDIPYVQEEWNKLLASYAKSGKKITGTTIIGRYISKMKLKQWRDYRWKDNEFLQQLQESRIKETMKRQGFGAAEIQTALEKATVDLPPKEVDVPEFNPDQSYVDIPPQSSIHMADGTEDYFEERANIEAPIEEDPIDLTPEDRAYLRLKWGKSYRPDEWVALEQLYNQMMESYDIQSAGHVDTLKLICKTSLKANQLIDIGDIEGYQKVTKVYDQLMKSGMFKLDCVKLYPLIMGVKYLYIQLTRNPKFFIKYGNLVGNLNIF